MIVVVGGIKVGSGKTTIEKKIKSGKLVFTTKDEDLKERKNKNKK